MADARFEDGDEGPLHLIARDAEDLTVISALVQDAVLTLGDLRLDRPRRRFALLLNRFRWEDEPAAKAAGRPWERVRSLLTFEDVGTVQSMGIDPRSREEVISLLSLTWAPGVEGGGTLTLILAGDGAIRLSVEALEVRLEDVTKPYLAPSRHRPEHRD